MHDVKSIVLHEKWRNVSSWTKAILYAYRLQQDATRANSGCTTPYQNPSLLLLRRIIVALYRGESRTVFGALNRRCPKPILEDGCDINRQGRQDETRRYLVGERIKPIEIKPVENIMIEMIVLDPNEISHILLYHQSLYQRAFFKI